MQTISWLLLPVFVVLLVSAALSLLIAVAALRRRDVPGATVLSLLMLAVGEWALLSALEMVFMAQTAKVLCSKFQYLGIVSVAPLLLIFVLQYTRQERWLAGWRGWVLWAIPVLTLAVVFTNEWHELIWSGIYPAEGGARGLLIYEHGLWFWGFVAYSYILTLFAAWVILWGFLRLEVSYRQQAWGLLVGIAIPWASNILYLSDVALLPGFDPTPVSFMATGLVMTWTLFRFRLLDLVPVARETVLENMSDGMIVVDGRSRVVDINPAARALLGLGEGLLVGQKVGVVLSAWPALAECCQEEDFQVEIVVEAEPPRTLDVRVAALRGRLGRLLGRVVALRDITQRKQAETEALLRSAALNAAANGITITDREGTILWVNPAFTCMTGYAAEEVIGRKPNLLKSGAHEPEFYGKLWETILAGRTWQGETVNRRKDGSLYTEEQTIAPVQNEQGQITHFIAVKQDISERKALEQFRDDLTYTMVHDLRNPLASIGFALEMFNLLGNEIEFSQEQKGVISIAQKNADRMARLVNSILDISRLESGQMPLKRDTVILWNLVAETIQLQMPLAAQKRLQLQIGVPADLPPVTVDAGLIGRVLQNLVDNAIKFSPQEGSVTVTARHEAAEQKVYVLVQDSGPGLSPEIRQRLFQKFAAGSTPGRGTGLGLAFCRLAVEAHQGRIWVEEGVSQGTVFTFTLPLVEIS